MENNLKPDEINFNEMNKDLKDSEYISLEDGSTGFRLTLSSTKYNIYQLSDLAILIKEAWFNDKKKKGVKYTS